jgi:diacylglycerol O-acyltransferase
MKRLTTIDETFLWLEKRNQPMHVGGLQLLSPPPDAPPDFVQHMVERLRRATTASPPFNQRLEGRPGAWWWTDDDDFDLEHHLRHVALPKPGRIRELFAMVSRMHAAHLDRARPLWELTVIEGIDGGRVAVYAKIHHAMMDGVAAMRTLEKALSEDPAAEVAPVWAMAPRERPKRDFDPRGLLAALDRVRNLAGEQLATLPTVGRELVRAFRSLRKDPDFVSPYRAPRSIFNQNITSSRRFAAQSYSLTRIRAAGKALGATVNDVVLAMCSSALRRYLIDLEALPGAPLIAMVPVSLRKDDSDSGNQVALILANLATDLADPRARIEHITRSVKNGKDRISGMTPAEIVNYTSAMMAPMMLKFATGIAPRWQPFNVIVSNVPGPKRTLYWNGLKVEGMYPVSAIANGQALNITLTSYRDSMEFGIVACRRTLPHIQRLLEHFEQGLVELEDAVKTA